MRLDVAASCVTLAGMRILLAFPFVLAACGTADLDSSTSTTQEAIINGKSCDEKTDPSAFAVLVQADLDLGGQDFPVTTVMCTGTLIAPDVLLTAAHCTDPALLTGGFGTVKSATYFVSNTADLESIADSNQQPPPPLPKGAIKVTKLVPNEQFDISAFNGNVDGPGAYHDIALMFLASQVPNVQPEVVIAKDEIAKIKQGAAVNIAGWGLQVVQQSQLQQPAPGTVGIKQCGDTTINELGDAEMQIGSDLNSVRKCHGDSGGPTYLDVGGTHTRTRRVIGVTSHAYDQSDCQKGGVDTRVDVWLDWLDGKMKAGCADKTRAFCDVPGLIPASFYDPPKPKPAAPKGCASTDASVAGLVALLALVRRRVRT